MIELPRGLLSDFRAALRRCLQGQGPRADWPAVLFRAGPEGLTLQAVADELALRCRLPGYRPTYFIAFPALALAGLAQSRGVPAALEETAPGQGLIRWRERGEERSARFATVPPETLPEFPGQPARCVRLPPEFLAALGRAAEVAGRDAPRYALALVQLRGAAGEVVATDGRQLLVQGGFRLPWKEDLLVPRLALPGRRAAPLAGPVAIGRTDSHILLCAGPWELALAIDRAGRYPDVQRVIPAEAMIETRLRLSEQDVDLLREALPKLPGRDDENAPVTLDIGPAPCVRARASEGGKTATVPLAGARVLGPPACVATARDYLLRALDLGFREVGVVPPSKQLCCRDGTRTYLWVPLTDPIPPPESAGPPAALAAAVNRESPKTSTERREPMSTPQSPGRNGGPEPGPGPEGKPPSLADVIAETEALRGLLQQAAGSTVRILAALKQQRRQSRAVEAAVASLRQLQLDH